MLVRTAARVIRALIAGERRLHRLSLFRRAAMRPGAVAAAPRIDPISGLMATRMRAHLRYVYGVREETRVFFGLLGSSVSAEKLADIRLRLAIAPAIERARPVGPEPVMTLAFPGFLEARPGRAGFRIRTASGAALDVALGPGATLGALSYGGRVVEAGRDLPLELSRDLIATLADWHRRGDYGAHVPIDVAEGNRLDGLLITVAARCADLMKILEEPFPYADPARQAGLGPIFGESYRLAEAKARFLVNLDAEGAMVSDLDAPDRQQFDIEAALEGGGDPPSVALRFWIPDFLVEGHKYFDRFFTSLGTEDGAESLIRAMDGAGVGADRTRLSRFLAAPEVAARAAIMRAHRGGRDDDGEENIVLIEGMLDRRQIRLLFGVRFDVSPWPEVAVSGVHSARLIGSRIGTGPWNDRRSGSVDPLSAYLRKNLALLGMWWARRAG